MQRAERCDIAAIASRDESARARGGCAARDCARLRLLRGAARRSRDRGDLQSAAERAACALDDQGAGSRQARAVREAGRARRGRGADADRGARQGGQAGRRGLHGALSSAMAARARTRAAPARSADVGAIQTFFSYRLLDPDNVRNRPPGGGGLYDIGCYAIVTARYMFGAEPTRVVATLDRDPKFGTDRLASAILEFPGGRHLTFSAATQLSAHQRVTIVGEAGRIEIADPLQRAARPADADRHRSRRRPCRRRRAGRGVSGLRPVQPAGRRLLPRCRSARRRSNSESRTRS